MIPEPESRLDVALSNGAPDAYGADVAALARTAADLREAFGVEAPGAAATRALFLAGVSASRSRSPLRTLAPLLAGLTMLALLGAGSTAARPGDVLYPIHRALAGVGLTADVAERADERISSARTLVARSNGALRRSALSTARRDARLALARLADVRSLLGELESTERRKLSLEIAGLEKRALAALMAAAPSPETTRGEEPGKQAPGEKSSSSAGAPPGAPRGGDASNDAEPAGGANAEPPTEGGKPAVPPGGAGAGTEQPAGAADEEPDDETKGEAPDDDGEPADKRRKRKN